MSPSKIFKSFEGKSLKTIVKSICGDKLGEGLYRDGYELKQNPSYVVKVEVDPSTGMFCNVTEWCNYQNYKEWEWFEQWLAPCELINETGQILIQKRVHHGKRKDYPKYVPSMFTDLKLKNFGWIKDRFVCCDYAFIPMTLGKNKLKYAKWWGTIK